MSHFRLTPAETAAKIKRYLEDLRPLVIDRKFNGREIVNRVCPEEAGGRISAAARIAQKEGWLKVHHNGRGNPCVWELV